MGACAEMNLQDHKLSSSTTFEMLGALWLRDKLDHIDRKTDKILMTQAELQQALADLGAKLTKALDEIRAAIERGGQTTPEVDAALTNARTVAQALDHLNPDA